MADTEPKPPSVSDAVALVRAAATDAKLLVHARAADRARQLGYDFDCICDSIVIGRLMNCKVEPNRNFPGKFVLCSILLCWAPEGEREDEIYTKFAIGRPPMLLSWHLPGSPA
jgi:hypothetical protein